MEGANEFCEADEREKGMVKVRRSKWHSFPYDITFWNEFLIASSMLAPYMICGLYYVFLLVVVIGVSVNLCTLVSLMIKLTYQNTNIDYKYLSSIWRRTWIIRNSWSFFWSLGDQYGMNSIKIVICFILVLSITVQVIVD